MERRILILSIILIIVLGIDFCVWFWFWPGFLTHKKSTSNNIAINFGEETTTTLTPTSTAPAITTPTSTVSTSTTTSTTTTTTTTKVVTPKKTPTPTKPPLSYSEAVSLYTNRRIQFDANCLAIPNYVVFAKGTKIMLDNRSSQARSVYLDGQRYSLAAYGFQIVTLTTTAPLPHTMRIDCGTGKNNGQILIVQ